MSVGFFKEDTGSGISAADDNTEDGYGKGDSTEQIVDKCATCEGLKEKVQQLQGRIAVMQDFHEKELQDAYSRIRRLDEAKENLATQIQILKGEHSTASISEVTEINVTGVRGKEIIPSILRSIGDIQGLKES